MLQYHLPVEVAPTQRVCLQLRQPTTSNGEIAIYLENKAALALWQGLTERILGMVEFHLVQPMKLEDAGSTRLNSHVKVNIGICTRVKK